MDPVYVQVISGFIVSIVSILVINFFVVKKKFLVPNLFSGVKMFRATMAASVRHNIKEVVLAVKALVIVLLLRLFFVSRSRSTWL